MHKAYAKTVAALLRGYKSVLSPWLPRSCRFLPTCSEYAAAVLVSHGPVEGGWLAVKRLCRCHPLGPTGYDPPPVRAALKCDA